MSAILSSDCYRKNDNIQKFNVTPQLLLVSFKPITDGMLIIRFSQFPLLLQVAEKERGQRLLEVYNRMDARSHVSHDGKKFKKSDILLENRKLMFEGVGNLLSPALVPPNTGGKIGRAHV